MPLFLPFLAGVVTGGAIMWGVDRRGQGTDGWPLRKLWSRADPDSSSESEPAAAEAASAATDSVASTASASATAPSSTDESVGDDSTPPKGSGLT